MENGKIISLINLFQHLDICRNLSECKIEFYPIYLVRNLQINAKNKLSAKYLLNILSVYKASP